MAAALHFGELGCAALHYGAPKEAMTYFNLAMQQTPATMPAIACRLMRERCDCWWEMGNFDEAVADMKRALEMDPKCQMGPFGHLPTDRDGDSMKWKHRGLMASGMENHQVSAQCYTFALYFADRKDRQLQATLYSYRAPAYYNLGRITEARKDIAQCRRFNSALVKAQGCHWRDMGVQAFDNHVYLKAVEFFSLALEFTPCSAVNTRFQVHTSLASCYFILKDYSKAVVAGNEAYKVKPEKSQDEARKWKERGKQLFKENKFDILVAYYSLAITYTPYSSKELLAQLLCNRSLVQIKHKSFHLALADAKYCVKLMPLWSKGHYRLGSSLMALKKPREAIESFSSALDLAEKDEEMHDTFSQVLTAAEQLKDGFDLLDFDAPDHVIQKAVDDAVAKGNWRQLQMITVDLVLGFDAVDVPLELVVTSQLKEKGCLVSELLNCGACVNGSSECKKAPLLLALETGDLAVASMLVDFDADISCAVEQAYKHAVKSEDQAKFWRRKGHEALQEKDYERAEKMLKLSIKVAPTRLKNVKNECYRCLADLYFVWNDYPKCVENGKMMFKEKPHSSEDEAQKWKERGNTLFKEKQFDEVIAFYSLALTFAPLGNSELRSILLSNRCAAYTSLKKFVEALADAQECVAVRPNWSKGYYRVGSSFNSLGRPHNALKAFSEGFDKAITGEDQFTLASQIISLASSEKEGTFRISCKFPKNVVKRLIKDACTKQDWDKLHVLFLGGDGQRAFPKGRGGVATGCDASAIPVHLVIQSSLSDRDKLIAVLLDHGASPNGTPGCKESPLEFALELENYPLAATLLKHGADSSCLGHVPRHLELQNQSHHWKDLGVKAMNAKQYVQAIRLLNLAVHFGLPGVSDIQYQVHSHLATAYFEVKRYRDAVDSGNKCFKIKPTKSQVEANRWKVRGKKLFAEKDYTTLIDYYTLAIKYVPSTDKEILATLLCNRALAHYNLSSYTEGLEDAKSCIRFQPGWFKGHVRQGYCYACLGQNREAVRAFGEGLRRAENEEDKFVILSQVVALGVKLEDGTSSVHSSVPPATVQRYLKQLRVKQAWEEMFVLYLGGGSAQRFAVSEGGLATGCSAACVPVELIVDSGYKKRYQLILALLENGALADGRGQRHKPPLALAVDAEEYQLAVALLQHNADPTCLALNKNDTPLTEALRLALTRGIYGFLQALLESECCDPDAGDANGNTLYHHVAFGKCSHRKCDVVQILTDAGVNPLIKNKDGKQPMEYLTKKDPRAKLMRAAANAYHSSSKARKTKKKKRPVKNLSDTKQSENNEDEPEWCKLDCDDKQSQIVVKGTDKKEKEVAIATSSRQGPMDGVRNNIEIAIGHVHPKRVEMQNYEADVADTPDNDVQPKNGKDEFLRAAEPVIVLDDEDVDDNDEADEVDVAKLDLESPFENLPWEVDCTDQFWKTLQSTDVSVCVKRRLVAKIHMLAEGRWTKKLCKRLEGLPRKHGILLFEAKLTRHARFIWELTVAFSARCSEDPEFRVQAGQSGGRVYSEIIRVWDVSGSHEALGPKIERIVKSHDRGLNCIVKKELQSFKKNGADPLTLSAERLPGFFVEVSEMVCENVFQEGPSMESRLKQDSNFQFFVPPASPNEMEYHILKFYSFSSALINSILNGSSSAKVDFPFRVTELEHAIINLQSKPPRSIILLGRSGTGKTTCCLYRLWSEFQNYWEKAQTAGPHIPKLAQFRYSENVSSSEEVCSERLVLESISEASQTGGSEGEEPFEFVRAKDAHFRDPEDEQVNTAEEDNSNIVEYEHLHQMFITKNSVLCSEVKKNFQELSRASPAAQEHVQVENNPVPSQIQEIGECEWPLFINSRDWFLLLDASLPGKQFFPRTEDGSLARRMLGWGEEDTLLAEIDEEYDSEEEDPAIETRMDTDDAARADHKIMDPRREVTYFVFSSDLWPKMMRKTKMQCHPTLVWTEIRSFIKGSAEALHSENGYLTLDEYLEIGRKRAPNFNSDRKIVYTLFQTYQQVKASLGMFDEADVVRNLYSRLQTMQVPEWSIHRIYVDETQDFTQAELLLLIRSSRDPNGLFFTGDTAQSIMRGISFRFSDLKSLFFHAQRSYQAMGLQSGIRVPNHLYQLTHNYRSHAGILRLASSVVDLLLHYFPESFDKLERDQGLFEGPRPVLLDSCSFGDLAMILRGNRRQSSRIEFGAHQVVLVASENSRANLPEELKQGLVMTIYESKGLEFDDVLIYNFFKDSQAQKEWRVVAQYAKMLEEGKHGHPIGLVELSDDELQVKTRPLKFDKEKHKILNSELKYLYTAVTRARVNVWFFDEDEESRAPVFEYFQKLGLVRVVHMSGSTKDTEPLTSMFVEKSTTAEWKEQGEYFYSKRLWEVAVKCFTIANDEPMVQKSQAQFQAAEAAKLRSQPKVMRTQFLNAAHQFLQCGMLPEAAVCLYNARERVLLAKLYKRLTKFEEAAKLFRREQKFTEASECFEMVSDYCQAVESLCQGGLYEEAIDTVERYNSLATNKTSREGIQEPKPSRTVERLCHQLAEEHFNCNRRGEMVTVLGRLPSADDRISFLENHNCISEAADALIDEGRYTDAAHLLRENGRFLEAAKLSNKAFAAECFVATARTVVRKIGNPELEELVTGPLEGALELYSDCGNSSGAAECLLMLGDLRKDSKALDWARNAFHHANNVWGEVDACIAISRSHMPEEIPVWTFLKALQRLFNLVLAWHKSNNSVAEQKTVELCEKYLGLCKSEESQTRYVFTKSGTRFSCLGFLSTGEMAQNKVVLDLRVVRRRISIHLCSLAMDITKIIRDNLRMPASVCKRYQVGMQCHSEKCTLLHSPQAKELFEHSITVVSDSIHLNAIVSTFTAAFERFDQEKFCQRLLSHEIKDYQACRQLYELLFPKCSPQVTCLSKDSLRPVRRHNAVKDRLVHFATHSWKKVSQEKRWCNSDLFILVSQVLHLIGTPAKVGVLLSVEEKAFEKKAFGKKLVCDGMTQDEERGGYQSFFRLLEHGRRFLYVYDDVLNSAHFTVRRFLSLPAWRKSMPLPSLANTAALLEQQMTSCLALFARLFVDYEYPVCLPESYLSVIEFGDATSGGEKTFSLSSAVEKTAGGLPPYKGIREVQRLLEYMVKLVCGRVGYQFNVVPDAFSAGSMKYVMSGEAERVLVLALTMLCNCGRGIPTPCTSTLVQCLQSIEVHEFLPRRIQVVLLSMERVTNIRDAVVSLQGLLEHRREKLFDLHWKNNSLHFDEHFDVASYHQSFHAGSSFTRATAQVQAEPPVFDMSSEFQMPAGYAEELVREHAMAEQEAECELAAVKIQRWYREQLLRRRQAGEFTRQEVPGLENQQLSSSCLSHFDQFKVDTSACSFCGVHFTPKFELDGVHARGGDGTGLHDSRESYVSHTSSDSHHWHNLREFTKYKLLYVEKVHPLNMAIAEIIRRLGASGLKLEGQAQVQSCRDFGLDLQRLQHIRARVGEIIRQIESQCNWNQATCLEEVVTSFENTVMDVQALLTQESATTDEDAGAVGWSHVRAEDEVYDDDELLELPMSKDGGGGKRSGKRGRKRRRKGKKDLRQS